MPRAHELLLGVLQKLEGPYRTERHGDRDDTILSAVGPAGQFWIEIQTEDGQEQLRLRVIPAAELSAPKDLWFTLTHLLDHPLTADELLTLVALAVESGGDYTHLIRALSPPDP